MSTSQQVLTSRHVQQHTDLTSTSQTSVFTATQNGGYVTTLHIVNDNMNQTTAAVTFYSTEINAPVVPAQTVMGNSTLTISLPAPFYLRDGEEMRVQAGAANYLHVWAFGTQNTR